MSITRAKTSSIAQGPSTNRNILAGNPVILPGSYESIATVDVGAGGTSAVEFTSISGTYKHLQIRGIVKVSRTTGNENLYAQLNGDTASNYSWHQLVGSGAAASASAGATQSFMYLGENIGTWTNAANMFSTTVIDILDYANTNKNKTVRTLHGGDQNGNTAPNSDTGKITFSSGNWRSTSAVTSIKLYPSSGTINQYSSFALYGIK